MKTFVLKARRGTTCSRRIRSQTGGPAHPEVILHTLMNAFFFSNGFRQDVELHVVLDSAADFPWTLRFSGAEGLSLPGFHEEALLTLVGEALGQAEGLQKNAVRQIAPGLSVHGHGLEILLKEWLGQRPVFLLDRKGEDSRTVDFGPDPVFVLGDHCGLPKNTTVSLRRKGARCVSLGKKMLFASQCVVLLHHAMETSPANVVILKV